MKIVSTLTKFLFLFFSLRFLCTFRTPHIQHIISVGIYLLRFVLFCVRGMVVVVVVRGMSWKTSIQSNKHRLSDDQMPVECSAINSTILIILHVELKIQCFLGFNCTSKSVSYKFKHRPMRRNIYLIHPPPPPPPLYIGNSTQRNMYAWI